MIDRFVQRCHIIDIDAASWRQKEALTTSESRSPPKHDPDPRVSPPAKKR